MWVWHAATIYSGDEKFGAHLLRVYVLTRLIRGICASVYTYISRCVRVRARALKYSTRDFHTAVWHVHMHDAYEYKYYYNYYIDVD